MHASDSAGVIAPPPAIFLASWAVAHAAHRVSALELTRDRQGWRRVVGGALIGAGASLSALVVRYFGRASTPVSPLTPTRALVVDGPYRYSRNPDYAGQLLVYAGAAIVRNRLWPLLLLPAAVALVTRGVIEREERYLEARFGTAYREYMRRVPRWL
jgi:protein-S-isoprenylcysteine O-methyltransferase Ste14